MSFSELEEFLKSDSDWVQVPCAPKIVSGTGSTLSKTDDGWKDMLKSIYHIDTINEYWEE